MNGYEALRNTCAWIDLSTHGKIRATGEDRARLLHAMTTNQIQELAVGQGVYVFFLNAQGRILADAVIYNLDEWLLLDTEPETRRKIYEHLDKYIIADDVTLGDETEEWAAIGVEGPASAEAMEAMGAPLPTAAYATASWGTRLVAKVAATGTDGFRIYAPKAERNELLKELAAHGVVEADAAAARTVRIEHGKPRYGEEITERYLVQETEQLHGVHFSKGCYLGQEIVERVRSRAQIHRHLAAVRIDGSDVPQAGTKLQANGKDVGEVVSAAYSPALGEVAALAYVRTEVQDHRLEFTVSSSAAKARLA
jgi:tRNA-modifying protein YgfZ